MMDYSLNKLQLAHLYLAFQLFVSKRQAGKKLENMFVDWSNSIDVFPSTIDRNSQLSKRKLIKCRIPQIRTMFIVKISLLNPYASTC